MEVYTPMFEHMLTASHTTKTALNGKAFHLLGFDLLFDSSGKAWLLEVNDNPSLDIFHTTDFMGGGGPKVQSKVDLEVKKCALGNSIKIAKMTEDKRVAKTEFSCYTRLCRADFSSPALSIFRQLRELFYSLCLIKNKKFITSGQFERILVKSQLVSEHKDIKKTDLHILM
jgi:tubulin polyglutamylase TTLL11